MKRLLGLMLLMVVLVDCGEGNTKPVESAPAVPTVPAPDASAIKELMTPEQLALGDPVVNSVGMVLVPIPPGEFQMGSPVSEADRRDNETQHLVKITQSFYLSAHEVTQQQYEQVMNVRPWEGEDYVKEGPGYPATHVNWDDVVEFCRKLSDEEGVEYRLPTEAEWEYACRVELLRRGKSLVSHDDHQGLGRHT